MLSPRIETERLILRRYKKKILYYLYVKELNIDNNKLYFLNNKLKIERYIP